jgi:hypothetical protein
MEELPQAGVNRPGNLQPRVGSQTLTGREHVIVIHGMNNNYSPTNPGYRDITGLQAFLPTPVPQVQVGEHPAARAGLLLHRGSAIQRLDEKILAIPWSMLTG